MKKYHIALSFSGDDRGYVEKVAVQLKNAGVAVFYDRFEEADLWGKDLYEHLTSVYRDQAMYTVIFVSDSYVEKMWGTQERKAAQARAFRESSEYILPAMFNTSVEVPGMLETTGYIDLNQKTPAELADLIVRKLTHSGVTLASIYSYSEDVKADIDYPIDRKSKIGSIIKALKSYNWYTQNPAIEKILTLDWDKVSADTAFILGRNMYQCACGSERRACSFVTNLRRELAAFPNDRATDMLNGMLFEVYFNSKGEFRGPSLKTTMLPELLQVQAVAKFSPSIAFIRRALVPYKGEVPFMPNQPPETVTLSLTVKKSDPPTVSSLKANGTELLSANQTLGGDLWRLSFMSFTPKELGRMLASQWGLPDGQLSVTLPKNFNESSELQLPEGTSVGWPQESTA